MRGRRLFAVGVVWAIAIQAVGAFRYQGRSDILTYLGPGRPDLLAWRFENSPFVADWESGFAPMPFLSIFGVPPEMQVPHNWFRATGSSR